MRALALVVLLAPSAALAAWPSDPAQNLPVCTATGTQSGPLAVSDGAGGAIFIWGDQRASSNTSVFAQHVDGQGNELWTANGADVLENTVDYVTNGAVCPDGASGAFCAWSNGSEGFLVHVQHVGAGGAPDWGATGVSVSVPGNTSGLGLVSDGGSGVIAVWRSNEPGGSTFSLRAQHLNAAGVKTWGTDAVVVRAVGSEMPVSLRLVADGQGGVLALWTQINADGTAWKIVAQHVTPAGAIAGDAAGVVLRSGTLTVPTVVTAADGAGAAYAAWAEKDLTGTSRVYTQRVGPNGAAQWSPPGALLTSSTYATPDELQLGPSADGDAIVAWKQSEATATWMRAQRLTPSGSAAWSAGGVPVCRPTHGDIVYVNMASDGFGGALFAYVDAKFTDPPLYDYVYDVAAARVTSGGAAPWAPTGVAVCDAPGRQEPTGIVADGGGGAIIGWYDERSGSGDVYAQNVHGDGTLGGDVTAVGPGRASFTARAWPLPARDHVDLAFTSAGGAAVVAIFDPSGRRVRELMREPVAAGETHMRWDGLEASGALARPGLYFAAISVAGHETMQRIVIAR